MKVVPISTYEQYKLNNTNFNGTVVKNEHLMDLIHKSNADGIFRGILRKIKRVNDGVIFEIKHNYYDEDEYGLGEGKSGERYYLYKKSQQEPNPKLPVHIIDSNDYPYDGYKLYLSIINDQIRKEYPDLFSTKDKTASKN